MQPKSVFLKSGSFIKQKYNKILIASIGAWFVCLIDGYADTFLAGAFLDETAVSAISLVQPVSSIVSFLAYLVSVGSVIMFSRESGSFNREKAYQYVGQGLISSVAISVFLVIFLLILREPMMRFYGASEEITALANEYYSCEIFFAAIYPIYFIVYQLVMIDGDELFSLLASLASAFANVLASLLMVNALGVKGLAIGTIIGTVAGLIVYCIHFLRKTNSVHLKWHFNFHELFDVIKISSSTSMTLLYVALIDIIMNKFVIANFGDKFLPAYAFINFLLNFGAVFCSLYDAGSGFVSVAYGEKNPAGIRKTMKIAFWDLLIISAALIILFEILAPLTPNMYSITDPDVRSVSVFAARAIALAFPFTAIYYLLCSYYPSVGRLALGHIISIIYMLTSPLILAIPLGLAFGFNGLSVGFALTSVIAVIITMLAIKFKYGKTAVPLALDETEEEYLSYELYLTKDSVTELCKKIQSDLAQRNIDPVVNNEVQLIVEESYMTILDENPGKKVMTECNLLISDESLRLITRDNGKIFDITDSDADVKNLRSYVLARLMEQNSGRNNTTTVSFNRNSYFYKL